MRKAVRAGGSPQAAARLSAPPPGITKAALPPGPRVTLRAWPSARVRRCSRPPCGGEPGRAVPCRAGAVLQEVTAASEPFPAQGSGAAPRCLDESPGEGGGRCRRSRGRAGSRVRRGWQKAARCEPRSASAWLIASCSLEFLFTPSPRASVSLRAGRAARESAAVRPRPAVGGWEGSASSRRPRDPPEPLSASSAAAGRRGGLGLALFRWEALKKVELPPLQRFCCLGCGAIAESGLMTFGCGPGGNVPLLLVPPLSSADLGGQVGSPRR